MRTLFTTFFSLYSFCLFAGSSENDNLLTSKGSAQAFKMEQSTITQEINSAEADSLAEKQQKIAAAARSQTSDIMIVDPQVVSKDWVDAFYQLKEKRAPRLAFILSNNDELTNIDDVKALPGGYLLLFTIKTIQGVKYKIVKTSEIQTLTSL